MGRSPYQTQTIYHIAERDSWSRAEDEYLPQSLERDGFIHASAWHQLPGVTESLFAGRRDVVVLEIDSELLQSDVVWEDLYDCGEQFPHVYGSIPVAAVTSTMAVTWEEGGARYLDASANVPDRSIGCVRLSSPSDNDIRVLARMNGQLIEDEGHERVISASGLRDRMARFLGGEYTAFLLMAGETLAGYALVKRTCNPVFLRQFFIRRGYRRRGIGTRTLREVMAQLGTDGIEIECLFANRAGLRFWHSLGFSDRYVGMRFDSQDGEHSRRTVGTRDPASQEPTLATCLVPEEAEQAASFLKEQIQAYNDRVSPHHLAARREGAVRRIAVMLLDANGSWRGGASGSLYWNWLSVDDLWVADELRGRGFGTRILSALEEAARGRGAMHSELSTFGFQARGFYEKSGYELAGTLDGYPPGSALHWMKKEL